MSEWIIQWLIELNMNQWINESMNQWINESMNQWIILQLIEFELFCCVYQLIYEWMIEWLIEFTSIDSELFLISFRNKPLPKF